MKHQLLKKMVWQANRALSGSGLIILTWGNASAYDREAGVIAIKPSGVSYAEMKVDDIVVLDIEGKIIDGNKKPSVDTPTHLEIYRSFPAINGIVHTHSLHATAFAQAGTPIECLGTTHADHFYGRIPVARKLLKREMDAYEKNTGKVIVELFRQEQLDPLHVPGCLVAGHGVFTWGKSADDAVNNGIVAEFLAKANLATCTINNKTVKLPKHILETHFLRKHGKNSYYGQGEKK